MTEKCPASVFLSYKSFLAPLPCLGQLQCQLCLVTVGGIKSNVFHPDGEDVAVRSLDVPGAGAGLVGVVRVAGTGQPAVAG